MTEHSKIPLPEGESDERESSLFERASGAFGLGGFKPAPMPHRLDERPMKRAKLRRKPEEEHAPTPRSETEPPREAEPDANDGHAVSASTERVPENLPAALPASQLTVRQGFEPVRFEGTRHAIDREGLKEQGLIVPGASVSALLEEFRIVKRQILAAAQERGTAVSRRVLVCSPHPGEGKTFCSVNLALSMANERDLEVLLVDADFAKPSILSTLGLPRSPGFMDCLADPDARPEDFVIGTDVPGLWVMSAGNLSASDSEYLSSGRTVEVLDRLTAGAPHRMVIFDTPPALAASPAAELAKHVGQAMLVARADRTGQSALEDAYQLLSACPDIKLLLNATNFSPSGRSFGSYYGYRE